jgi:pSer/pThr/pTyr-binding forkhead associated (FHA) protein
MSNIELKAKMTDSSVRICASCNHENLFDAAVCVHCGATLGSSTIIVPDRPLGITRTNYLSQIIRLHEDALVLLIATQDQPIVLKGDGKFLIGRQVENEPSPTLDMTKYGGHTLGVSRRHAMIFRTSEGYTIEDLGSANGSYVNEKRLQPNKPVVLRNGDLLRLGQLILFAYFTPPREKNNLRLSDQTIWLKEEGNTSAKLTLQQLTSQVIPYLNALETLQNVIDHALKRTTTPLQIIQIVFEKDANRIKVVFMTRSDVIPLIVNKLNPLRQKNVTSPSPAQANEPVPAKAAMEENNTTVLKVESETEVQEGDSTAHRDLAANILGEVAPTLAQDAKESFIQRLLVPLHTLTSSRFELMTQAQ